MALDAEQLKNAQTIASVGHSMGATVRDIEVAIMTALQESSLRNLPGGDRDSAGLFQQRPSQGWGTYSQVTDPNYASRKFYSTLMANPSRNDGLANAQTLAAEAQSVQRSGFPTAYEKWYNQAVDLVNGGVLKDTGGVLGQVTDAANAVIGATDPMTAIANTFTTFGAAFSKLPMVFEIILKLADPTVWVRIMFASIGITMVFVGVFFIGREVTHNG